MRDVYSRSFKDQNFLRFLVTRRDSFDLISVASFPPISACFADPEQRRISSETRELDLVKAVFELRHFVVELKTLCRAEMCCRGFSSSSCRKILFELRSLKVSSAVLSIQAHGRSSERDTHKVARSPFFDSPDSFFLACFLGNEGFDLPESVCHHSVEILSRSGDCRKRFIDDLVLRLLSLGSFLANKFLSGRGLIDRFVRDESHCRSTKGVMSIFTSARAMDRRWYVASRSLRVV